MATDNRDQILKEIESLSLEKYIDELAGAVVEGLARCKTEKDVWNAVEVLVNMSFISRLITYHPQIISVLHRRFSKTFTPALVSNLAAAISVPPRISLANLTPEQREKEDSSRVARQRPIVRVCSELALVGVIRDAPDKCGGEWIMKAIKELVIEMISSLSQIYGFGSQISNDPSLSSLPLLTTFLKSYSKPFLGIYTAMPQNKHTSSNIEPDTVSDTIDGRQYESLKEDLIEQDVRDRFKRMCEGYFDNICKKLIIEHKVCVIH